MSISSAFNIARSGLSTTEGRASLVAGNIANAQTEGWVAPQRVADNPVLDLALSRWGAPDGQVVVVGPDASNQSFVTGGDPFWGALLGLDSDGLISEVRPVDGVALSYFPPFTVWFPTEDTIHAFLSSEDATVLEGWDDTDRAVWLFNIRDLRADSPSMYMIYFKLDHSEGEQPNHCHAQQVVTVLYTGETDDPALRDCLAGVRLD